MSKILALWTQYKWVVFASLFLAVAAFSWDISSRVSANEFNAERIRLLQQTIEVQAKNKELEDRITKTMFDALAQARIEIEKSNKAAINEILTDPRYRTCTITDGVRNAYTNAIRAQSSKRGPASAVPSPKGTPVQ